MDPFLSIVLIRIKDKEKRAGTGSLQARKVEQEARGRGTESLGPEGNLKPHTFTRWPDVGHYG